MIRPDWVGLLLDEWARGDWAPGSMGYPGTASFAQHAADDGEGSSSGFSLPEIHAMRAAVDWLALAHPDHWRALNRALRPQAARELPERRGDQQRLLEVGEMLARYIDEILG